MRHSVRRQHGALLLEALIGILIFSIGILALVAMQATAISQVTDARYRTEAAYLADRFIGNLWANKGTNISTLAAAWTSEVSSSTVLPNASGTNAPTVVVAGNRVTVTVRWQAPGASNPSNHIAIAYLDFNP